MMEFPIEEIKKITELSQDVKYIKSEINNLTHIVQNFITKYNDEKECQDKKIWYLDNEIKNIKENKISDVEKDVKALGEEIKTLKSNTMGSFLKKNWFRIIPFLITFVTASGLLCDYFYNLPSPQQKIVQLKK